jgi:hypothetical protein
MKDLEAMILADQPVTVTTKRSKRWTDHRHHLLSCYKEQFEVEEVFKDIKWLQRLEWQRVGMPAAIPSLLLFVFFGWLLLWRYGMKSMSTPRTHPKKRLSWVRMVGEQGASIQARLHFCF